MTALVPAVVMKRFESLWKSTQRPGAPRSRGSPRAWFDLSSTAPRPGMADRPIRCRDHAQPFRAPSAVRDPVIGADRPLPLLARLTFPDSHGVIAEDRVQVGAAPAEVRVANFRPAVYFRDF